MTRLDAHFTLNNIDFKKRTKSHSGVILSHAITPIQTNVTFIPGVVYKITFKYLCNVPGCRVHYNIYKGPNFDLAQQVKNLEHSKKFKEETLYLTCNGDHKVQDVFIRLWNVDARKKVFIEDFNVEVANQKSAKIMRSRYNNYTKPGNGQINEKIKKYKLKTADVAFLAFVKDEGKYYLDRMIKSLIDYVPKLVIVDTGSTDNTDEIISKYQHHKNLKFVKSACSEKEIYKGINEGISEIKNKWIFIIAGDEAMLKEDLFKIPEAIEDAEQKEIRAIRVSYLDFIGDDHHYHTKYKCSAYRIWRNFKDFHFGGDFQGDIFMGYNDGIQTGGVETKKNMPDAMTLERFDIFFHHYARCKPKNVLLKKRIKYYERRIDNPTKARVLEAAKKCPFYTLDLPTKVYDGPQAGLDEKPTFGFYTGSIRENHFAKPILKELVHQGYDVTTTYDTNLLPKLYQSVDYLWIEWGEKWLLDILRKPRDCKIIVRIHRYEVDRPFAKDINWNNADLLWFVNQDVEANFRNKFPDVSTPSVVIPNAVDVDEIKFQDRKKFGKKIVLFSIRFSDIKDFPCAIKIFDKVSESDDKFSMTLRAMVPPEDVYNKLKVMAKGKKIDFITDPIDIETIDDKSDINALLKGKDIFLSTSNYESFHYAVAESLASGLQVFVRSWDRGGNPEDFWAPYLCKSEQEMADKIIEWSELHDTQKQIIARTNRQYVRTNFGPEMITGQFIESLKFKEPPHVGVIMPVYNNEKYLEETIETLLNQRYKHVTVIAINDTSTDDTNMILAKYSDRILVVDVPHGGAHNAMSYGLKVAKVLGVDYTIFDGSDDLYNVDYIEELVKKAEENDAYLSYSSFKIVDKKGSVTGEYISQRPNIDALRKDSYICDHSLTSAKFWDVYGWKLRVKKFKAYSVLHAIMSNFKMFPGKQVWVNRFLWRYRVHGENLHIGKKKERKGQRKVVVKDIFGE